MQNKHLLLTILVIIYCLTQLGGCGRNRNVGKSIDYDGPPQVDIDVADINDAEPKVEPLHPYGTRNYFLRGRHYRVLKSAKGYVKRGYASWYGSSFHGRQTSTQERYNLYAMTAASPELPLPSYVQVTNLRNGKKIIVRINDRGPYCNGRIIDLSYAAAKKLDFVDKGIAPVKVVGIDPREWCRKMRRHSVKQKASTTTKAHKKQLAKGMSEPASSIFLQVGAFTELANAKKVMKRISSLVKQPVQVKRGTKLYHVHIGPLVDNAQRDELKLLLEGKGYMCMSVT